MSKFIVKVWETEHDRDMGECDSSYFDTLDEALAEAKSKAEAEAKKLEEDKKAEESKGKNKK